ncbi:MAG: hypothetical protein HY015_01355 [Bacteroidetes bacterium]|nr:hypothetical protein [Bacteroidota bacterium]MBI3481624.1 hypothetical protein [Bacteroidota bacterium]
MKVINIHRRNINQPKARIGALLETLASENDMIVATDKWPRVELDKGLNINSKGGHGPIKYTVQEYKRDQLIQFRFTKPLGFNGIHKFEITEVGASKTEIKHTIDMTISGNDLLLWTFAIRWLHDAFIEDAFDKVENHFTGSAKVSEWSLWVKLLRRQLRSRGNN